MDDCALPPLSGLCLHEPSDEEFAPDETSGPAVSDAAKPIGRDNANHQLDLRNWKNLPRSFGLNGRWESKVEYGMFPDIKYVTPEFWFQNNPDFYNGWVPIAQQEGLCHKREVPGGGTALLFPTAYIFRVVGDAIGQSFRYKTFHLVDGSNMFQPDEKWINKWRKANALPSIHKKDAIVICFVKTDTLKRGLFSEAGGENWHKKIGVSGETAAHYTGFRRVSTLLKKLTTQPKNIFLIQMDTWEPGKSTRKFFGPGLGERGTKGCRLDPRDPRGNLGNGYEHLWCEYDDILMLCMQRQLALFSRSDPLLCPVELWTDDKGINKPDDEVYRAFQMYLEYNDTFLLRIFQPLSGFVVNFQRIMETFEKRYDNPNDYVLPVENWPVPEQGKPAPFSWNRRPPVSFYPNINPTRYMQPSSGATTRDVATPSNGLPPPSLAPGTWFANDILPVPPGWDTADTHKTDAVFVALVGMWSDLAKENYKNEWDAWRMKQQRLSADPPSHVHKLAAKPAYQM